MCTYHGLCDDGLWWWFNKQFRQVDYRRFGQLIIRSQIGVQNMKFFRLILASTILLSTNVMAALDASSLKLQVYSVMMSTSSLCTSPITVFSSTSPTEVDFLATPTLGSGNPPDGTYNCIIIKMSDNIKYTPITSSGSCIAATEYVSDICRADNSSSTLAPDAGGSPTLCHGTTNPNPESPVVDIVYLYLTTNSSAGTDGNTFLQPPDASSGHGLRLTTPLVISGTARSKFVVNATGKVDDTATPCGMNPPIFGFVKL
jgi:hypothetical protein